MSNRPVLIVEDDDCLREAIAETIQLAGYETQQASNAENALEMISNMSPELVVSDVCMPGMNGHQLLKALQAELPGVPVILLTAHATVSDAVDAMRNGAIDYLTKPFEPKVLMNKIGPYLEQQVIDVSADPIAHDPESQKLLSLAQKVAATDASVMISGESGTGKEVLARYIHEHSPRHTKPFVAINCAAIPENMLEATLFGYEKGAFTGAYKATPGKFEQAQGGTLLLDEISEMDLNLQAKLLRVLQEKEVERIGSNKLIDLDVRVLSTTNRDMPEEIKQGKFREDLFYRLNVFPLHWQPLRERKKDIIPLAEYLINRHSQADQVTPLLDEAAKQILIDYHWPGNAREMDNVIQRALILKSGDTIHAQDLHLPTEDNARQATTDSALKPGLKQHEYDIIMKVCQECDGNRQSMSETLGISQRTLRYKLSKMRDAGYQV